MNPQCCF